MANTHWDVNEWPPQLQHFISLQYYKYEVQIKSDLNLNLNLILLGLKQSVSASSSVLTNEHDRQRKII